MSDDPDFDEAERHRMIEGLVGQRHYNLYNQEAEFHAQIHVLAPLVMAWMDGLAAQAIERHADYEKRVAQVKAMGLPQFRN